jgi:hypothetical protein
MKVGTVDNIEINIDVDILSILGAWSWHDVGIHTCPVCHHNATFFARHVGFIFGGHRQLSCGCRLARRAEDELKNPKELSPKFVVVNIQKMINMVQLIYHSFK